MRRRSSLILIGAGVLVIGLSSGFLYSRVSQFRFSDIDIRPENTSAHSEVQRRMMRFLGKSLFSISLRDMEESLREIPSVESVVLHRNWPTRISVELRMRESVAMVFESGRLWSVSGEGMRIEPVKAAVSLPLLKNFPSLPEVRSADVLDPKFLEFFRFLRRLRNGDSNFAFDSDAISEVRWNSERGFSVWSFESEIEADLGFDHFDRAWRMLDRVIAWSKQNALPLEHVDASFQSRAVVRTKGRLQNSQIGLNLEELVRRKDPEAAVR